MISKGDFISVCSGNPALSISAICIQFRKYYYAAQWVDIFEYSPYCVQLLDLQNVGILIVDAKAKCSIFHFWNKQSLRLVRAPGFDNLEGEHSIDLLLFQFFWRRNLWRMRLSTWVSFISFWARLGPVTSYWSRVFVPNAHKVLVNVLMYVGYSSGSIIFSHLNRLFSRFCLIFLLFGVHPFVHNFVHVA